MTVKGFLNSLGWLLFLVLAVVFLLFYNFAYVPRADRVVRQQNEIAMWIGQVEDLQDTLKMVREARDSVFSTSFTFDELFGGAVDFKLAPSADSALRVYIPTIQAATGIVEVIGHTDNGQVPPGIRERYPGNLDYAAAAASAVARGLAQWGVASARLKVVSLGPARPVAQNRRVEIIVRKQ
jgi:outer membrane protein OmpA-like peptidoglycan-associated protein